MPSVGTQVSAHEPVRDTLHSNHNTFVRPVEVGLSVTVPFCPGRICMAPALNTVIDATAQPPTMDRDTTAEAYGSQLAAA